MLDKIESAYNNSLAYMFENDFYSHDPYDGLNTQVEFLKKTKWSRLGLVYFNKFSPVNCRRIFGVQKSRSLLGLSTIANAMLIRNNLGDREMEFVDELFSKLKRQTLKPVYGYHCWDAHEFPIQMRKKYVDVIIPSSVGGEVIGTFLMNYYKYTRREEILEYITESAELITHKFYCEKDDLSFFKYAYTDQDDKIVINGSLKAAAFLMKVSELLNINTYDDMIIKAIDTAVKLQKEDGHWSYTYFIESNEEKRQIDFHQGFILDDLLMFMERYGFKSPYIESYQKGLDFYYRKQFFKNGQGIYRYPKKWPVNIHNQAQGMITFSKAGWLDPKYPEFARRIADWTIENMQDKEHGHFYYLKYPFFTNKIPYFRWSDANMLLALSELMTDKKPVHV